MAELIFQQENTYKIVTMRQNTLVPLSAIRLISYRVTARLTTVMQLCAKLKEARAMTMLLSQYQCTYMIVRLHHAIGQNTPFSPASTVYTGCSRV